MLYFFVKKAHETTNTVVLIGVNMFQSRSFAVYEIVGYETQ